MNERNLIIVGKHWHYTDLKLNSLDDPLYSSLASHFNLTVISQGPVIKKTIIIGEKYNLLLLPRSKVLNTAYFIIYAFIVIRDLVADQKNTLLSASEPYAAGVACFLSKLFFKQPYVLMLQGDALDLPPRFFSKTRRVASSRLAFFLSTHSLAVRTVSRKIREALIRLGVSSNKVFHIRNRVDEKRFSPNIQANQTISEFFANKEVVCFVGGLTHEKGFSDFVRAMQKLLTQRSSLGCLIIGQGPLENTARQELEMFSDRTLFAGFVEHKDLAPCLQVADVFCFCSFHEGMPRALLEYMAMGKPVITTNVGGIDETATNDETAFFYRAGDVADLVNRLQWVLERPDLAAIVGSKARDTVATEHGFVECINQQVLFYHDCFEKNAG